MFSIVALLACDLLSCALHVRKFSFARHPGRQLITPFLLGRRFDAQARHHHFPRTDLSRAVTEAGGRGLSAHCTLWVAPENRLRSSPRARSAVLRREAITSRDDCRRAATTRPCEVQSDTRDRVERCRRLQTPSMALPPCMPGCLTDLSVRPRVVYRLQAKRNACSEKSSIGLAVIASMHCSRKRLSIRAKETVS